MAKPRKSFPLRVSQDLYGDLQAWAEEEMRSVNAQIEFLLRTAVRKRKGQQGTPTRSDAPSVPSGSNSESASPPSESDDE